MTVFKGTKGKWEVASDNYYTATYYIKKSHSSEDEANALLISKAPEMLEMLVKVLEENMTDYSACMNIKNEIEKLIKEATEL